MIVLPHPEQAIFRGRSSLSTGIGVAHAGQLTVGMLTTAGVSVSATAGFNLLGLTNAVSIHKTDAPPDAPKTNKGG